MKNELAKRINEFFDTIDFQVDDLNLTDYISAEDIYEGMTFDDVIDHLNDTDIFNKEVIYYTRAMDYLCENDCSLSESLSIAAEFGYPVDSLNSELLASLLMSQNVRDEFYETQSQWEEFLSGLDWYKNEDDE